MALNAPGLASSLSTLFTSPPNNINGCATSWANAMQSYAVAIVPASITVTAAATALDAELQSIFPNNNSPSMIPQLETAFANFATVVGSGMVGFTATPPPGLVGFASIGNQASTGAAALVWAALIDAWMRTGLAAQIAPPLPPVNWS